MRFLQGSALPLSDILGRGTGGCAAGLVGLEDDHVPVASRLTAGDMRTREGARRSSLVFQSKSE